MFTTYIPSFYSVSYRSTSIVSFDVVVLVRWCCTTCL